MMGWGNPKHLANDVTTPLYARAIAIRSPKDGKIFILVCVDLCFVSELLRVEVVKRLGLHDDEIMISATHTHSAPGGFSSYVFYDLCTDGFKEEVFESYASGTVRAIQLACASLRPGKIHLITGKIPLDQPVAFNRSVRAWNRNPETKKYSPWQREHATNREMRLLRFDDEAGAPIASWNWFSVHATSMHRSTNKIHSDNKGIAAEMLEKYWQDRGVKDFVGVFAQGAAGDVTPNFKRHKFFAEKSGPFKKDEDSCNFNANIQFKKALELMLGEQNRQEIKGPLFARTEYHDFTDVRIRPEFANGREHVRTGPAEMGLSQLYGTAEGRGMPWWLIKLVGVAYRIGQILIMERWNRPVQGLKKTMVAAGSSEVFGATRAHKMIIPDFIHPSIMLLKRWSKRGVMDNRPLVPQLLPLQILRIGQLAIAAVPAEFTTVAGWRLEKLVQEQLKDLGISRVVTQGYANAYCSYVTTPEEYDQQGYEGGSTLFGKYTLSAYLMHFHGLCQKLKENSPSSEIRPKDVPVEYLRAMS
jgi:neutral ceramidase